MAAELAIGAGASLAMTGAFGLLGLALKKIKGCFKKGVYNPNEIFNLLPSELKDELGPNTLFNLVITQWKVN